MLHHTYSVPCKRQTIRMPRVGKGLTQFGIGIGSRHGGFAFVHTSEH